MSNKNGDLPENQNEVENQEENAKTKIFSDIKKERTRSIIFLVLIILAVIFELLICALYFDWFGIGGSDEPEVSMYTPSEKNFKQDEETGVKFVDNIILVYFKDGTDKKEVEKIADSVNGKIVGVNEIVNQYQIQIKASNLDEIKKLCDKIEKNDSVVAATYDGVSSIKENAFSNDNWGGEKNWNTANPSGNKWWLEAINAPGAWDYNDKLNKIRIGVVDNGFEANHEDLKGIVKYTSDTNKLDYSQSAVAHGNHVAGIIGAKPNNGVGIAGIVWNCELYTYDWMLTNDQMAKYSQIADSIVMVGLTDLVQKGAKVVNFSLGASASLNTRMYPYSNYPQQTIDASGYNTSIYMYQLLSKGYDFVVVQSSGNGDAKTVSVDARNNLNFCSINEKNCMTGKGISAKDIIDRIIVVGAAENLGNNKYVQAYFSNAGPRVDICAPGFNVYSLSVNNKYELMSGTSMASPIVAGVTSLVWAANEDLSGAQVKKIVCDSNNTAYVVADNTTAKHPLNNTYRMVNAKLAVEAALKTVVEKKDDKGNSSVSTGGTESGSSSTVSSSEGTESSSRDTGSSYSSSERRDFGSLFPKREERKIVRKTFKKIGVEKGNNNSAIPFFAILLLIFFLFKGFTGGMAAYPKKVVFESILGMQNLNVKSGHILIGTHISGKVSPASTKRKSRKNTSHFAFVPNTPNGNTVRQFTIGARRFIYKDSLGGYTEDSDPFRTVNFRKQTFNITDGTQIKWTEASTGGNISISGTIKINN